MAALHTVRMKHSEGSTQVFHALVPVEASLSGRVANALECAVNGDARAFREQLGDGLGLVEFALAPARGVQGHGHEEVERSRGDSLVIECLRSPVGERVTEIKLTIVFESMHEIADYAAAHQARDGAVEMKGSFGAI